MTPQGQGALGLVRSKIFSSALRYPLSFLHDRFAAVEARRPGIYGVVTDMFQRPLAGASVEAIGNRGGTQTTDSAGRFAFPDAVVGAYMIRARHAGYAERRVMLSVERGRGRELSIGLTAGAGRQVSNAEAAALSGSGPSWAGPRSAS